MKHSPKLLEVIRVLRQSQGWHVPDRFGDQIALLGDDGWHDDLPAEEIANMPVVSNSCEVWRSALQETIAVHEQRAPVALPHTGSPSTRSVAATRINATEAETRAGVVSFREAHLPEGLLDLDQQKGWVMAWGGVLHPRPLQPLVYWQEGPGGEGTQFAGATEGTTTELLQLVASLTSEYWWAPSDATTFVICGTTPSVDAWTATFRYNELHPATSRLTFEVDPTLAVDEVTKAFITSRTQLLSGTRTRSLAEESLDLAVLFAETPDLSWEERRQLWNRSADETTRRDDVRAFSQATRRAVSSLMQPSLLTRKDST
jgi:hypothetical protein